METEKEVARLGRLYNVVNTQKILFIAFLLLIKLPVYLMWCLTEGGHVQATWEYYLDIITYVAILHGWLIGVLCIFALDSAVMKRSDACRIMIGFIPFIGLYGWLSTLKRMRDVLTQEGYRITYFSARRVFCRVR